MEVHNIFSIPLFSTPLRVDNQRILNWCLSERTKSEGRFCSNNGGWQSNDYYNYPEETEELFREIHSASDSAAEFLNIRISGVSNYWININDYKSSNHLHCHPHTMLSGAYYVQVPENSGCINFQHPAEKNMQYDWDGITSEYSPYCNLYSKTLPKVGTLLIFPSWLYHYVEPNLNQSENRISISFNIG